MWNRSGGDEENLILAFLKVFTLTHQPRPGRSRVSLTHSLESNEIDSEGRKWRMLLKSKSKPRRWHRAPKNFYISFSHLLSAYLYTRPLAITSARSLHYPNPDGEREREREVEDEILSKFLEAISLSQINCKNLCGERKREESSRRIKIMIMCLHNLHNISLLLLPPIKGGHKTESSVGTDFFRIKMK